MTETREAQVIVGAVCANCGTAPEAVFDVAERREGQGAAYLCPECTFSYTYILMLHARRWLRARIENGQDVPPEAVLQILDWMDMAPDWLHLADIAAERLQPQFFTAALEGRGFIDPPPPRDETEPARRGWVRRQRRQPFKRGTPP